MLQKPRILILSTAYLPLVGGSELAIHNLTSRMTDFVFDVVTARYSASAPVQEEIGNVRVFRAGGRWNTLTLMLHKAFLPLILCITAWRLARTHRYALVHAFQASQAAGAGFLFSYLFPEIPFIVTLQEGKVLERQPLVVRTLRKRILARADAITVISNYLRRYATAVNPTVPVHLVPNGVAVDEFADSSRAWRDRMRERLGIGINERVIMSVSRLVPKNGMENLLLAFEKLRIDHKVRLVIVGDGPLRSTLERLARQTNCASHVTFVGAIDHRELPLYLGAADVFVRPSLSEGLGSAFLEAMACRVPVVASPVGGIPDFLEDGRTGLFCNPTDPTHIAATIARILDDSALAKLIVERGFLMVRTRYDWDSISETMARVYRASMEPLL